MNKERDHFFTEQNIVCENRANVPPYTVRGQFSHEHIHYWEFLFSTKNSFVFVEETVTYTNPAKQHTAKNLFAKRGKHLQNTIRCTSLFRHFIFVLSVFVNSV